MTENKSKSTQETNEDSWEILSPEKLEKEVDSEKIPEEILALEEELNKLVSIPEDLDPSSLEEDIPINEQQETISPNEIKEDKENVASNKTRQNKTILTWKFPS